MSRVFEDEFGNEVIDVEYRLPVHRVILALLETGVLTAEHVLIASDGMIVERLPAKEEAKAKRGKTD